MVGQEELVMIESMAKDGLRLQGRTENNRVVNIDIGNDQARRLIGKLLPVRYTEALAHSLRGELIIQE